MLVVGVEVVGSVCEAGVNGDGVIEFMFGHTSLGACLVGPLGSRALWQ